MNFSPFGGHFTGAIPSIHQFAASGALASSATANASHLDNRYAHPHHHSHHLQPPHHGGSHQSVQPTSIASPVNIPHFNQSQLLGKLRAPILTTTSAADESHMNKYGGHTATSSPGNQQHQLHYGGYSQEVNENGNKHLRVGNSSHSLQMNSNVMANGSNPAAYHQSNADQNQDLGQHDNKRGLQNVSSASSWQAPSSTVADYLSHLPASTLPLSLHHFLKYSAETIKKESNSHVMPNGDLGQQHQLQQHSNESNLNHSHQQQIPTPDTNAQSVQQANSGTTASKKKKKKKSSKPPKEKKPRPKPGEIRLTTALDGSTLFCCPECQMAYPERGLLEQHLVGHNLERRFICDICNAALKRKDHLTRHKQSHNPERPYVCTICLKAFKRKEQLTLHFVIHSGEKRHICTECGKGFYRKDHLRKHTRSHIARRVKAELSQQQPQTTTSSSTNGTGAATTTNSAPSNNNNNNGPTSAASLVVPNIQHHQQMQQQAMGRPPTMS